MLCKQTADDVCAKKTVTYDATTKNKKTHALDPSEKSSK